MIEKMNNSSSLYAGMWYIQRSQTPRVEVKDKENGIVGDEIFLAKGKLTERLFFVSKEAANKFHAQWRKTVEKK